MTSNLFDQELIMPKAEIEILPVSTEYPTTNASKAGMKFLYRGNEWRYMTQAEIDSCGWTGLVEIGFPAPVEKIFNVLIYANGYNYDSTMGVIAALGVVAAPVNSFIDFLGLGFPNKFKKIDAQSRSILSFKNAHLLTSLQDAGTSTALVLTGCSLSKQAIDELFTALPTTTVTVTLDVSSNPGAATCVTSIATNKGYTVKIA